MRKTCLVLLAASLALTLSTRAAEPRYWRVLLPIIVNDPGLPGAHGSVFVTSLAIFNANSERTIVAQRPLPCPFECEPISWAAHSVVRPIIPSATNGTYIYIADLLGATDPSRVVFSLRAQDVTRQALTLGTDIPVAREEDFADRLNLLDVPLDARFRQTLRIYDLQAKMTDVIVRIYPMEPARSSEVLAERRVTLATPRPDPYPDFPGVPAYAQIGDFAGEFPSVRGLDRVRVEITSADPSARVWGFATITHHETQHITVIKPN